MRAAHAADQRRTRADVRCRADQVSPGTAGVDNPIGTGAKFTVVEQTAGAHAGGVSAADLDLQNARTITGFCAVLDRLAQPLSDESFGEFTLGIVVMENGPALVGSQAGALGG